MLNPNAEAYDIKSFPQLLSKELRKLNQPVGYGKSPPVTNEFLELVAARLDFLEQANYDKEQEICALLATCEEAGRRLRELTTELTGCRRK